MPKVLSIIRDWLRHQVEELQSVCRANDSEKARAMLLDLAWGNTLPIGQKRIVVTSGEATPVSAE